jgi:signal transduction histidine kinase
MDKLFIACAPSSDLDPDMCATRISDNENGVIGFLIVPQSASEVLDGEGFSIFRSAVRMAFERISSTCAEDDRLRASFSAIAGQLLRVLEDNGPRTSGHSAEVAADVLQEFLDYIRSTMKAEKCALFLVQDQGQSLTLERISEEPGAASTCHYEKIIHIPSYDLRNYNPMKLGQGVTPWVLHRKKPFNARSYEELLSSSEGHHKGNWDSFIYGGNDIARRSFQCVYMTPLLAGEKSIGVLKCENRTANAKYPYFDHVDERQINQMAGVLSNLVVSQRIEKKLYDTALPAISKILLQDFGQPKLFKSLLIECRRLLHADLCAMFVVADGRDLVLRALVGLEKDKENKLRDFRYSDYRSSDARTCLVLREHRSLNTRSYQDMVDSVGDKGLGRWDKIVYEGKAHERFKSLCSIPLRIADEDIGVLKMENKNVPPYYFTESDERLLVLIGRLIAISVKYDNESYFGLMLRAAEMGFLASGIAHEFNTYLQVLDAIASRIKAHSAEPNIRLLVRDLSKQVRLASQAIENFRVIRDRKQEVETFLVDELVEQVKAVVGERFKKNKIALDYHKGGLEVRMNKSELQSILINLLRNAHDAIAETNRPGRVILRIRPTGRERFVVEVLDNGKGIDANTQHHLFAPYFSTKAPGGGMGMGLFWIQRLLDRNGGSIMFESKNEYGGATFRVELPLKPMEDTNAEPL